MEAGERRAPLAIHAVLLSHSSQESLIEYRVMRYHMNQELCVDLVVEQLVGRFQLTHTLRKLGARIFIQTLQPIEALELPTLSSMDCHYL